MKAWLAILILAIILFSNTVLAASHSLIPDPLYHEYADENLLNIGGGIALVPVSPPRVASDSLERSASDFLANFEYSYIGNECIRNYLAPSVAYERSYDCLRSCENYDCSECFPNLRYCPIYCGDNCEQYPTPICNCWHSSGDLGAEINFNGCNNYTDHCRIELWEGQIYEKYDTSNIKIKNKEILAAYYMIQVGRRGRDFDIGIEKLDWESPVPHELFDVHGEPLGSSNTALVEPNPYGQGDVLLIELNKELINPDGVTPIKVYATVPEEVSFEAFTEVSPIGLLIIYNGFYNYTIKIAKNELLKSIELNASLHGGSVHVDVYKRNCTDSWPQECGEWNFITSFEFSEDHQEIDFPRYIYGDDELKFDITISPGDLKHLPEIYELSLNTAMINIEPKIFVTQVNDNIVLINHKPTLLRVKVKMRTDDREIGINGIPVIVEYKTENTGLKGSKEFVVKDPTHFVFGDCKYEYTGEDCVKFFLPDTDMYPQETFYANVTLKGSDMIFVSEPLNLNVIEKEIPYDNYFDILFIPVGIFGKPKPTISPQVINLLLFFKDVYPLVPSQVREHTSEGIVFEKYSAEYGEQLLRRWNPKQKMIGRRIESEVAKTLERICVLANKKNEYVTDRCVGLVPSDFFEHTRPRDYIVDGLQISNYPNSVLIRKNAAPNTLAHEIAHTYGIDDNYAVLATNGWRVRDRERGAKINLDCMEDRIKFYSYMHSEPAKGLLQPSKQVNFYWSLQDHYYTLMNKIYGGV